MSALRALPRALPRRLCVRQLAAWAAAAPLSRPSTRSSELEEPGSSLLNYYATCSPGLEAVLAAELQGSDIRASRVQPARAGVRFSGDQATGYRAALWLRSAVRVLQSMHAAELEVPPGKRGGDALYEFIRGAADWAELLPRGATFSVEARVYDCEDLAGDALAATRVKDAVCDALRAATGAKPEPPLPGAADLPLFLTAYKGQAVLYRDLCGVSLHKRGYRAGAPVHKAALNESVAAGILMLANWQGTPAGLHAGGGSPVGLPNVLADPFCGSGTFLCEAGLMSARVAPGLLRRERWPLQSWPDYSAGAWRLARAEAVETAEQRRRELARDPGLRPRLLGCDLHGGALGLAESSVRLARMGPDGYCFVRLEQGDVRDWQPRPTPTHVVTNPPWGARLGEEEGVDVNELWFALGSWLKRSSPDASVAILCGNREAAAKLFLKPRRHPLVVGGIDCRLLLLTMLPKRVDAAE